MKKKYLVSLLAIVMCFALVGCGKKISLDEISKKFNDSEIVKTYKEYGFEMNSSVDGNKLVITTKTAENKFSVSYNLEGNILSNDKLTNEYLMPTAILIDCIGQLQGYKEGELTENLNAFPDEVSKYTLKKEGFELKEDEDTNSIKIDLSKKIPLINLSNLYLKTDDFDMIKEIISEKSVGNQTGKIAKLAYDIVVGEKESEIYIGEKEKLTDSAYKSILSALEVMYGTEVSNKFKSLYPNFKNEKTIIDRFTIDTNYKIEEDDESIFKNMQVVLVTINNDVK